MNLWLYQLSEKEWPPGIFRRDIWEGRVWHFSYPKRKPAIPPAAGEIVVFSYAKTGCDDHGIYGWGIIERLEPATSTPNRLYFIPSTPTNHLKMDPWSDERADQLVTEMRGPVAQGSLFRAVQDIHDLLWRIRTGINQWLYGQRPLTPPPRRSGPGSLIGRMELVNKLASESLEVFSAKVRERYRSSSSKWCEREWKRARAKLANG